MEKELITLTFTKEQIEMLKEACTEFYYAFEDMRSEEFWQAFSEVENKLRKQ